MNTEQADYSQYTDAQPGSVVNLSQLQALADQQLAAEKAVEAAEKKLTEAKEALKLLSEVKVPQLMDEIGIAEFKTASGVTIKVDEIIRASIPKARFYEALAWLKANNHAALIKRTVSIAFGKGEDEAAQELEKYLTKQGYSPSNDASVHAQTLSGWVREKLANGEEIPLELLGVFRQRVSKIKT